MHDFIIQKNFRYAVKCKHYQRTLGCIWYPNKCFCSIQKFKGLTKEPIWLKLSFFSVPPQGAEIQGPLQPFTCSRDYYIECKVWGSNPPARIEWFRGTSPNHGLRPLKAHNQTVVQGGNVTISWLHYQPKATHHHQTLICRGSNDDLMTATSQTVEDYHRMEIFCKFLGPNVGNLLE